MDVGNWVNGYGFTKKKKNMFFSVSITSVAKLSFMKEM